MSDVVRKVIALSILIIGAGLLWAGRRSYSDAEDAKNEMDATVASAREHAASDDPRLKGAYRFERGGWVYVHLEGDPSTIGFQHGYLLAKEIEDAFAAVSADMMHSTNRDWPFFREVAREKLWPKLDQEYQQELEGIAEGLNTRTGSPLDVYDFVALQLFRGSSGLLRALARQAGKESQRTEFEESGKLQRVRRHRKLDQRRANRDCA